MLIARTFHHFTGDNKHKQWQRKVSEMNIFAKNTRVDNAMNDCVFQAKIAGTTISERPEMLQMCSFTAIMSSGINSNVLNETYLLANKTY